jgi:methylated-DNA-protein-cysteine methyltransferase-like protein
MCGNYSGVIILSFYKKVYDIVTQIPRGKVATYGMIAKKCDAPRASRQVGWALNRNPNPGAIPCHRVVNRFGYLSGGFAFGGIEAQKALLMSEGVKVNSDYKVDLNVYLWRG